MRPSRSLAAAVALLLLLTLSACTGSSAGTGGDATGPATPFPGGRPGTPPGTPDIDRLVGRMTDEEKVGQLFVPVFSGTDAAAGDDLIKKYHLGGVIYFPGNLRTPRQTAALSNALQRAALSRRVPIPLLIGIDQEQGIVTRLPYGTKFPGNMAQAATRRPADVTTAARVTGTELRALGINTDFAPVADVNVNPANPVIGIRSFGSEPREVARLTAAAIDGFRAAGIATVAKHFPGHGDTDTDSHTGLPVIDHSVEQWERLDAPPFRAAIARDVDGIMSAHIVMPHLGGRGVPATLSKRVLTGLLRERLGFSGIVVTDALNMAGARKRFDPGETAVRAVLAGADQLLMPPDLDTAHRAVLRAVRSGSIPRSRLDEAVTRVLRVKAERGMFTAPPVDPGRAAAVVGSAANRAAARAIAGRSITLVKNARGVLPVGGRRVFVSGDSAGALAAALWDRGVDVVSSADQADVAVVGLRDAGRAAAARIAAPAMAGKPVVAVALGTPYDLTHTWRAAAALATYSNAKPSLEAVAGVLAGKVRPEGRLPVAIPKRGGGTGYARGHGLGL